MNNDYLLERITLTPDLLGGRPAIRGMRVLVSDILEMLATGMSEENILEQHPILEKEDIQAALFYASRKVKNTAIIHAV